MAWRYSNAIRRPQGILILGAGVGGVVNSGTAETQLGSVIIPPLRGNDSLRITTLWSYTNSANNKTLRHRISGAGGTALLSAIATTSTSAYLQLWLRNNNATNAQKYANTSTGAFLVGGGALLTSAIDFSVSTLLYLSGQTASGGESITLEHYTAELIPGV